MLVRYLATFLFAATPIAAEEMTVATWNLNHLAAQEGTGCNPRQQSDYDAIKDVINKVDADIWLFQEVESVGALARVMDSSKWRFIAEDRQAPPSPGICADGINTWTMQRTITAVKKDQRIISRAALSFLDVNQRAMLRYGTSVTLLVNGHDVEIVNIHLKAGCKTGTKNKSCDALFEQIPFIAAYASEKNKQGRAIMIAGDFNRTLAEPNDGVMNTLGYNKDLGLEIASHTDNSACSIGTSKPIDYQLVSRFFRASFTVDKSFEFPFNGDYKSWPSDHCPVVVRYELK